MLQRPNLYSTSHLATYCSSLGRSYATPLSCVCSSVGRSYATPLPCVCSSVGRSYATPLSCVCSSVGRSYATSLSWIMAPVGEGRWSGLLNNTSLVLTSSSRSSNRHCSIDQQATNPMKSCLCLHRFG
jgi:hypothetical protein